MERVWSGYQQAIFDAIEHTQDSLEIQAVAGSGKTTTIVEAIKHVPVSQSIVFLAFNKSIATELGRRVTSPNATCRTLHSAGLVAWKQHLAWDAAGLEISSSKTRTIIDDLVEAGEISEREQWAYGGTLPKLIGIAKGAGLIPYALRDRFKGLIVDQPESDDEDLISPWEDFMEFYDIDPDRVSIPLARRVLIESILRARQIIDYDDMLYMPVIAGATFEKYDVVFLDEAQDVNGLQVEMVSRMVRSLALQECLCPSLYVSTQIALAMLCPVHGDAPHRAPRGGRVIAVGDQNQSIYGFRGCLDDSMGVIAKRFGCRALPLSVSYRCPRLVVRHAQRYVRHIESHDAADDGLVETPRTWSLAAFEPTDAILCRITRPLIETAFRLIRARVPCKVIGRDIGQNLVTLVKKMKAKNIGELIVKLAAYRQREALRLIAKKKEAQVALLDDKLATLDVFIGAAEPDATIETLIADILALFGEAQEGVQTMVTLSTIHKAKGLEFDRVFILDADQHMPSPWAKQDWQRQQEDNLAYVAITRAKRELRYISSDALVSGASE